MGIIYSPEQVYTIHYEKYGRPCASTDDWTTANIWVNNRWSHLSFPRARERDLDQMCVLLREAAARGHRNFLNALKSMLEIKT